MCDIVINCAVEDVDVCTAKWLIRFWQIRPVTSKTDQFSTFAATTRNITSHSMRNLAVHSFLRWKMIILYQFLQHHDLLDVQKVGKMWTAWCLLFQPVTMITFIFLYTPSTPKSDQFHISRAASTPILHHTVWRTWLFMAYSDERWLYYQFLTLSLLSSKSVFSQPFKKQLYECCSENL